MKKENSENLMEKIVSFSKRRGFVFPGSEIYGGLAGTYDYGPLGLALKNNIKKDWWKTFVENREDIFGIETAILMNQKVWEASGHVSGFSDPLVECRKCKRRFRADQIENASICPECGGTLGEAKQFNMMFKTQVGASEEATAVSYLRPETAQGMFVNFKNIIDAYHPKLPFGLAQIGRAFRNEIAPRDFLFRTREFEQMEIEYFVKEGEWKKSFEDLKDEIIDWLSKIGLKSGVSELEVPEEERAHYSKRTIDFEFEYPFGRKELCGLAYRTDFDLKAHAEASKTDFSYLDEETKEKFIPHCIEPSFGVDRLVLAILTNAYTEDELGGEKRAFLRFSPAIAPIKAAVFPLLKNKPELVKKAQEVYQMLKKEIADAAFDDNGNIGKRYRRQDEIGTPFCITIDFQTLEDDTVTLRDRDSGEQRRLEINGLLAIFKDL